MRVLTILLGLSLLCIKVSAQSGYKGGAMFQLKPDFSFENDWKLNTKLESRQVLFEGLNKDPFQGVSRYERSDLEMVLSKKLSPLYSVGAGYLIRLEDGIVTHRFIQQFSIAQSLLGMRVGHRFRTDETFEGSESTKYRLRYRIGMEKPLNGQEVDPGEFYLEFNNEYLQSLQNKDYDLEVRVLAAVGFNFSDMNKLALGVDYRVEKIFSKSNKQLAWLNAAWYISF